MGVHNGSFGNTEKRRTFTAEYGLTGTGLTLLVCPVSYSSELRAARIAVSGVSGSPTFDLRIQRFIPGAGLTVFSPGTTTLAATAFGTSGIQSFLLQDTGGSLILLAANDVISITTGGANSAVASATIGVVLQAIQDIKTQFGI
jgi:hypothetical protein